jgi:regulator of replication initiation timing
MTHRFCRWLLPVVLLCPVAAIAQNVTLEQLQKSLDDANSQLKSAQDRKNELAQENQKLQKQLNDLRAEKDQLRQQLQTIENRAYYMREHYAAWQLFVEANPALRSMWVAYFTNPDRVPNRAADLLGSGQWPFTVEAEHMSMLTGQES